MKNFLESIKLDKSEDGKIFFSSWFYLPVRDERFGIPFFITDENKKNQTISTIMNDGSFKEHGIDDSEEMEMTINPVIRKLIDLRILNNPDPKPQLPKHIEFRVNKFIEKYICNYDRDGMGFAFIMKDRGEYDIVPMTFYSEKEKLQWVQSLRSRCKGVGIKCVVIISPSLTLQDETPDEIVERINSGTELISDQDEKYQKHMLIVNISTPNYEKSSLYQDVDGDLELIVENDNESNIGIFTHLFDDIMN